MTNVEFNALMEKLKRRENDITAAAAASTEALSKLRKEAALAVCSEESAARLPELAGEAIAQLTCLANEANVAKLEAWTIAEQEG